MPQRDIFHGVVREALVRDGWTVTHDPYPLQFGESRLYVDLAEEPDRVLYLAIPPEAYAALFDTAPGRDLVAAQVLRLLVFDPDQG